MSGFAGRARSDPASIGRPPSASRLHTLTTLGVLVLPAAGGPLRRKSFVLRWLGPRASMAEIWLDEILAHRQVQLPMIKRRLGPSPHAEGQRTVALNGCPDIFELMDGDFAVIGIEMTVQLTPHLPADASCGPDERIVRVPRRTMILAKPGIPEAVDAAIVSDVS